MININIDYVIYLLAKTYAYSEEGAKCGDSHCSGAQIACQSIIDELAENVPEYPVARVFNDTIKALSTEEN